MSLAGQVKVQKSLDSIFATFLHLHSRHLCYIKQFWAMYSFLNFDLSELTTSTLTLALCHCSLFCRFSFFSFYNAGFALNGVLDLLLVYCYSTPAVFKLWNYLESLLKHADFFCCCLALSPGHSEDLGAGICLLTLRNYSNTDC